MFNDDAQKSIWGFQRFVSPCLSLLFNGDVKIYHIENDDSPLAKLLDCSAGIDAIIVTDKGAFAVASRIQNDAGYRTFTIRRSRPNGVKTEFDKLTNLRGIRPSFHCHAYIGVDGAVVGIAPTQNILNAVNANPKYRADSTGETFFYTDFSEVDEVRIFSVKNGRAIEKPLAESGNL